MPAAMEVTIPGMEQGLRASCPRFDVLLSEPNPAPVP